MVRAARAAQRAVLTLVNAICIAALIAPHGQAMGLPDGAAPSMVRNVSAASGTGAAATTLRARFAADAAALGLHVIGEPVIERVTARAVALRFTAGVALDQRTAPTFLLQRVVVVAEQPDGSSPTIAETDLRIQYADEHVVLEYVDSFSSGLDAYAGRPTGLAGVQIRRTAELDSSDLEAYVARRTGAGGAQAPAHSPDQPDARNYVETVAVVPPDGRARSYDAGQVNLATLLPGLEGGGQGITVGCVTNCFQESGGAIGLVTALCLVAGLAVCVAACAASAGVACLPCIAGAGTVCGVAIAAGSLGVCIARCLNPSFNPPAPTATRTRTPTFTPTPRPCPGDCDGNRIVTVAEIVRGVRLVLSSLAPSTCARFDVDGDGTVTVNELVAAVNAAVRGCGGA